MFFTSKRNIYLEHIDNYNKLVNEFKKDNISELAQQFIDVSVDNILLTFNPLRKTLDVELEKHNMYKLVRVPGSIGRAFTTNNINILNKFDVIEIDLIYEMVNEINIDNVPKKIKRLVKLCNKKYLEDINSSIFKKHIKIALLSKYEKLINKYKKILESEVKNVTSSDVTLYMLFMLIKKGFIDINNSIILIRNGKYNIDCCEFLANKYKTDIILHRM